MLEAREIARTLPTADPRKEDQKLRRVEHMHAVDVSGAGLPYPKTNIEVAIAMIDAFVMPNC